MYSKMPFSKKKKIKSIMKGIMRWLNLLIKMSSTACLMRYVGNAETRPYNDAATTESKSVVQYFFEYFNNRDNVFIGNQEFLGVSRALFDLLSSSSKTST